MGWLAGAVFALGACGTDSSVSPPPISASLASSPGDAVTNVPESEVLTVCKVWVGATVADIDVTLSGDRSGTFTVPAATGTAPNTCRAVAIQGSTAAALITVTEADPGAGFTTTWAIVSTNPANNTSGTGRVATATIGGGPPPLGAVITFTNTFTPPPPPPPPPLQDGRMTGGGRVDDESGLRITFGLTIHCDILLSNNIEINWGDNQWHIDKPITDAACTDDPTIAPAPPVAPFDTFDGEATGRLNGVDGSLLVFTFIDGGEPGTSDQIALQIFAPGGALVLDLPLTTLTSGNIQAHYDQPHGQKP
jgi:hypothetical protein